MFLSLRDYQEEAVINSNRIYESDSEYGRLACVVLPTGGGKSFVAIEQLIGFNNSSFDLSSYKKGETINSSNMLYIAPTTQILNQIKIHIVKHVLHEDISTLTTAEIDAKVKEAFPGLKLKCYAGIKESGDDKDLTEDKDIVNADFIIADEAHRLGAESWGRNFYSQLRHNSHAKILAITATPDRTDKAGKNVLEDIARNVYEREIPEKSQYVAQEIYVMDATKDGICVAPEIVSPDATLALSDEYDAVLEVYNRPTISQQRKMELDVILTEMEALAGISKRSITFDQDMKQKRIDTIAQSISNKSGKYIVFIPKNQAKNEMTATSPEGVELVEDSGSYFSAYIEQITELFSGVLDENGNPVELEISFVTSNSRIRVDKDGKITTKREGSHSVNNSEVLRSFESASSTSGKIKILISNDMLNEGVHVSGIDGVVMLRNIDSSTTYLQQTGRCISSMDPNKPLEDHTKVRVIDLVGNTLKQINARTGHKTSYSYDLYKIKQIQQWLLEHDGKFPDINAYAGVDASSLEKVQAEKEARLAIATKRLVQKYSVLRNASSFDYREEMVIQEIFDIANSINIWNVDIGDRDPSLSPSQIQLEGIGFLTINDKQNKFMDLYYKANVEMERKVEPQTRIRKLVNILSVLKRIKPDLDISIFEDNMLFEYDNGVKFTNPSFAHCSLKEFIEANFAPAELKSVYDALRDFDMQFAQSSREIYCAGDEVNYDIGEEFGFVKSMFWTSELQYHKRGKDLFEGLSTEDLVFTGIVSHKRIHKDLDTLSKISMLKASSKVKGNKNSKSVVIKPFIYDEATGSFSKFGSIDNIGVDIMDRFRTCSFLDCREVSIRAQNRPLIDGGYDPKRTKEFEKIGENYFCKTTNDLYDEDGFDYYGYDREGFDILGYNREGFDKQGFEMPMKPQFNKDGIVYVAKYHAPLYHRRNPDGSYDSHGYEFDESKDGRNSLGMTRANSDQQNSRGFYKNGAKKDKPAKKSIGGVSTPYFQKSDLYDDDGFDAFGFDERGFKKVKTRTGKYFYVNRDTGTIYDEVNKVRGFTLKEIEEMLKEHELQAQGQEK